MKKEKDLGIVIASGPEEVFWQKVLDSSMDALKMHENEIKILEEVIIIATKKIAVEQSLEEERLASDKRLTEANKNMKAEMDKVKAEEDNY